MMKRHIYSYYHLTVMVGKRFEKRFVRARSATNAMRQLYFYYKLLRKVECEFLYIC